MEGGSADPKGSEAAPLGHHSTRATRETKDCLSVVVSVADPGFAAVSLVVVSVTAAAAAPIAAALQQSVVVVV